MRYRHSMLRLVPILIILICLLLALHFNVYHYLNFESLKQHHLALEALTHKHFFWFSLLFIVIYTTCVAISLPGAALFTMAGGFLFGIGVGLIYAVISATTGSVIVFLAIRFAFAEIIAKKTYKWTENMKNNFEKNAFHYLIFIRLVPIIPLWLSNIVPALLNMRFSTYLAGTFIGIIPGTFIYILLGNSLNNLFEKDQTPNFSIILEPQFFIPLLLLGLLALLPVVIKQFKKEKIEMGR